MVANERLRLETEDLRRRAGKHDPRVARLEGEVARLKALLEEARAARDELEVGVRAAVEALRQR
jgi:hypothetical protein